MMSEGRFQKLSGRKRFSLVKRLKRLYTQLDGYVPSKALKTAMAGAAILVMTLISNKADAQNFAPAQVNPFGIAPTSDYSFPEFVDIDNDSDLDLFVGEYYGGLKLFMNIGTPGSPAFDAPLQNPFGLDSVAGYITAVDFADMDNDGDFDCFIGSTDNIFLYFENIGTQVVPNFAAGVSNPFGITGITENSLPELADLDGDGDFDLMVGAYYGVFQYFENIGSISSPSFDLPVENPFGLVNTYGFASPCFADIEGDGDLDMFVGSYSPDVMFFRNTGTASAPAFEEPIESPFGIEPLLGMVFPDMADLDNDGDLDMLVGEYYGQLSYFENISVPNDLGVWSLQSPSSGCGLTDSENISVEVTNFGTDPQSGFTVSYQINGGTPTTEAFVGTLSPGESAVMSFTGTGDLSTIGDYNFKAWTNLVTDTYHENDTLFDFIIVNKPIISSFPYLEDFEDGAGGWFSGGFPNTWELGTPGSGMINVAASGINAWKTNLTGTYEDNEQSYVESPCFDFSDMLNPAIRFNLWFVTEEDYDGATVLYSTDNVSWNVLGAFGDPAWFNTEVIDGLMSFVPSSGWAGFVDGYGQVSHLTGLAGEPNVSFRIFFGSDGSVNDGDGVAFDDFEVYDEPIGVEQVTAMEEIQIYPNPSNGVVHLLNAENTNVEVRSLIGELLFIEEISDNNSAIDLSAYAEGTYILKITSVNGVITKKVIVNK